MAPSVLILILGNRVTVFYHTVYVQQDN